MQKDWHSSIMMLCIIVLCGVNDFAFAKSDSAPSNILNLDTAIQKAYAYSPQLKVSEEKVNAAIGAEKQSSVWLNPAFLFTAENFGGTGQYSGTTSAEYTYILSQTFEIGGKRAARKNMAHSFTETNKVEYLISQINLGFDVETVYLNTVALEQDLAIATEQEQIAQKIYVTVKNRVDAARELESQQYKALVALELAKIKKDYINSQLIISREQLAQFWCDTTINSTLDEKVFFKLKQLDDIDYYISNILNYPQMVKLNHMINQKIYNLKLEKAQRIPNPTVSGGLRELRDSQNRVYVMDFSFPIPIFDKNKGNIVRVASELNQIHYQKHQTEIELRRLITSNWYLAQQAYREAQKLQKEIIPVSQKSFTLTHEIYEKGKFSYIEVLDAQRTLFNTKTDYYSAIRRYHQHRIELEKLVRVCALESQGLI